MLIRKMLRDIWKNKVQFAAIFIMMFLGCFLFSGITGEWNGIQRHFQKYQKQQNLADYWLFSPSFQNGDRETILGDENVLNAEGRMLVSMSVKNTEGASVDCYFAEENQISTLYVREGKAFENETPGIWLDYQFASANDYHLGDTIAFTYGTMEIHGEILGLADSPEFIYGASKDQMTPDHKNYGFAWISTALLPEGAFTYNQIAVRTENAVEKKHFQQLLSTEDFTVLESNDHPTVSMITDEITQHQVIGTVFSSAFLLIAVLITMTTMHRVLKNQRMQIGILKALGFNKKKLYLHYLSHTTVICLLGAEFGMLSGYKILPEIIYKFLKEMYVLPEWSGYLPISALLLPGVCTLICIALSFLICRKYLRENASEILYGQERYQNMAVFSELPLPLSFAGRWNLRDIGRNRLRSFMTLLGVLGCTALLFCAFGIFNTFTNLSEWTFTKQQAYECKITGLPNEQEREELLKMTDGEYLMEGSAIIQDGTKEKSVGLTVIESTQYLKLAKSLQSFTEIRSGIALSKKTAESLGVKQGDTLEWKLPNSGSTIHSKVEVIIRTPMNQGITILRKSLEEGGMDFAPTAIIGIEPEDGFGMYNEICTISHQSDLTEGMDTLMEAMIMMIGLLVSGAVILGSVMLYNLGVLSYFERYREFATLKVLGFSDGKIRKIMIQQNVWLSAAGILLGLPAGYGLIVYMMTTIQESLDVPIYIRGMSWVWSILGTLFLSWLISRAVSGKIRQINMVEALKAKE